MQSEALRNIRTMRQVCTGLDLARNWTKPRMALDKSREEFQHRRSPSSSLRSRKAIALARERQRFDNYVMSIKRSRERLLQSRESLAAIIEANRALTQLRHDLQRKQWGEHPSPSAFLPRQTANPDGLRRVGLEY